jgi:hypothetical protein
VSPSFLSSSLSLPSFIFLFLFIPALFWPHKTVQSISLHEATRLSTSVQTDALNIGRQAAAYNWIGRVITKEFL